MPTMKVKELLVSLEDLTGIVAARAASRRILIGISGPPGAGKSTCASGLALMLNCAQHCRAAVIAMDGYHYDDAVLRTRDLYHCKGAQETFDVGGLHQMLKRLRRNVEPEIAVPVFDRDLEISRSAAKTIEKNVNVVIVEGNYLLLNHAPWHDLAPLFDVTAMIRIPEDVLRERLVRRWQTHGVAKEQILAKVDANDLPNGRVVLTQSIPADFIIET